MTPRNDDRIFNRDGLRHYRRTYSLTEVRIGLAILALLGAIAAWVAWKGKHQDPELFSLDPALLDKGDTAQPASSGAAPSSARRASGQNATARPNPSTERGPVPAGLAGPGWSEQTFSSFDPDTLYEKINGREGYYKSFGFQMLYFIALSKDDDETMTVDIEMYDLGSQANALGAYAGERQPDVESVLSDAGLGHTARNAMFLVRGRFYIRAVGADENDVIKAQLAHLQSVLDAGIEAEALPWGYAIFAGQMGLDPGKVGFVPENAYSFGFAKNVFNVQIDDEGAELFMVATESEDAARALARQFAEGFASYGEAKASDAEVQWIADRYLGNISGVKAVRTLVIGAYSVAELDNARAQLARLEQTASSLSDEVLQRAASATTRSNGQATEGGYSEGGEPAGEGEGAGEGENEMLEGENETLGEGESEMLGEGESPSAYDGDDPGEPSGSEPVEEM